MPLSDGQCRWRDLAADRPIGDIVPYLQCSSMLACHLHRECGETALAILKQAFRARKAEPAAFPAEAA
jgi:hypothetical protein